MPVKLYKFILFTINNTLWGMPLLNDSQFIHCGSSNITLLPNVNANIIGLAYHNGEIITLLNTAGILGVKSKKVESEDCLLFGFNNDFYGLLIDEARDTVKVKKIFTDRHKKQFNKYIKVNNQNIYILEPMDIWKIIDLYD